MNPTHTIVDRDGWLFVREAYTEPSKPQTTISYWPIGLKTYYLKRNYGEEKLGGPLTYKGDGLYEDSAGLRYRLQDGGQTRMTLQETEPIACPKTRNGVETRYQGGYWQKYLKTRGWVAA
jgi:hypothetical protein